ncbi:hypothetical protein NDU88_006377, partial [Pleurodeles waltl]
LASRRCWGNPGGFPAREAKEAECADGRERGARREESGERSRANGEEAQGRGNLRRRPDGESQKEGPRVQRGAGTGQSCRRGSTDGPPQRQPRPWRVVAEQAFIFFCFRYPNTGTTRETTR